MHTRPIHRGRNYSCQQTIMLDYFEILNDTRPEKELYFELGRTLFTREKYRRAVEFLEEAKLCPGPAAWDKEIFLLLGEGYKCLSKPRDAFASYLEGASVVREERSKIQFYNAAQELVTDTSSGEMLKLVAERLSSGNVVATDLAMLQGLTSYINNLKASAQAENSGSGTRYDSAPVIAECLLIMKENRYKQALAKVEEAFTNAPDDNDLLFLKLRILVEGQIDLAGATALFNDEDFGYRHLYTDHDISEKLTVLVREERSDGNTFFRSLCGKPDG